MKKLLMLGVLIASANACSSGTYAGNDLEVYREYRANARDLEANRLEQIESAEDLETLFRVQGDDRKADLARAYGRKMEASLAKIREALPRLDETIALAEAGSSEAARDSFEEAHLLMTEAERIYHEADGIWREIES